MAMLGYFLVAFTTMITFLNLLACDTAVLQQKTEFTIYRSIPV